MPEGEAWRHFLFLAWGRLLDRQVSFGRRPGSESAGAKVKGYLNERGFRILKALDEVAAEYRTSQTQVALAWLLSRPAVTAPIASATSLKQFDELIAATRLELSPAAIQKLTVASH